MATSPDLTEPQLTQSTSEIGHGLAATPLPLAAGAWAGLSAKSLVVASRVRGGRDGRSRATTQAGGGLP